MSEWVNINFDKLAKKIKSGGTPKTTNELFYNGDIPFVSIEDITASKKYIHKTKRNISKEGLESSNTWLVPEKSILYSIYASLGEVVINDVECATNQAILGVIPNNEIIDTEFLYYKLLDLKNKIHKYTGQTTQSNLSATIVRKFVFEIPKDPNEQTQISNILSTIDKAIAATEQLIIKYQRIKTGLLHDLLTRGIDEQGNLRSEKMHKFKDSKLGRIPVEWEPSIIGKSCFVRNELRFPLSQDVRAKMQGDYPYYGPTGIFDYLNEYRVEGKYVLIGEDGDHFLKYKTQEQTILVEGNFNVNNHAHILEGSKDCLTEWIHLFFSLRDITLHLTRQGAGRYKLNKTSLLNLNIALPNVDEQKEILKRVDALKKKNEQDKVNLTKLHSLKIGLMQDLLSGRVRVK